jgi:hypothetical protein
VTALGGTGSKADVVQQPSRVSVNNVPKGFAVGVLTDEASIDHVRSFTGQGGHAAGGANRRTPVIGVPRYRHEIGGHSTPATYINSQNVVRAIFHVESTSTASPRRRSEGNPSNEGTNQTEACSVSMNCTRSMAIV